MTIKAHLNPGLAGGNRSESLDLHAARLYETPRAVMCVAELLPVDRVVPIDGASEKDPLVRLRIESLEVAAAGGPEDTLRDVARALFTARTAAGTLTSEDEVALAEQTLEHAAGILSGHEVARLRVILDWALDRVAGVLSNEKLRPVDIRNEVTKVVAKAAAARDTGVQLDLEGAGR